MTLAGLNGRNIYAWDAANIWFPDASPPRRQVNDGRTGAETKSRAIARDHEASDEVPVSNLSAPVQVETSRAGREYSPSWQMQLPVLSDQPMVASKDRGPAWGIAAQNPAVVKRGIPDVEEDSNSTFERCMKKWPKMSETAVLDEADSLQSLRRRAAAPAECFGQHVEIPGLDVDGDEVYIPYILDNEENEEVNDLMNLLQPPARLGDYIQKEVKIRVDQLILPAFSTYSIRNSHVDDLYEEMRR